MRCPSPTRRAFALAALFILLAGGALAARPGGAPAAAAQPDPEPVWKAFRPVWQLALPASGPVVPPPQPPFGPWGAPPPVTPVRDLLLAGDRLYYAAGGEVVCLDAVTGNIHWRLSPSTADDAPRHGEDAPFQLALAGERLFVTNSYTLGRDAGWYEVFAIEAGTGRPLWRRELGRAPHVPPAPAGDLVVLWGPFPGVVALRQTDGRPAWSFADPDEAPRTGDARPIRFPPRPVPGANAVILQHGAEIRSLSLADGSLLWTYPVPHWPGRDVAARLALAAAGEAELLHVYFDSGHLQAIDPATGEGVWSRAATRALPTGTVGGVRLEARGELLIFASTSTLVGIRASSGETAWVRGAPAPATRHRAGRPDGLAGPPGSPFLVTDDDAPPLLDGKPGESLAVPRVQSLIALDPAAGAELWRWQPPEGYPLAVVRVHGDRLIVASREALIGLEPGEPDPLPADPAERRALAVRVVEEGFPVPDRPETPPPLFGARPAAAELQAEQLRQERALLMLLRLGADAVEPALDQLERHLPVPPGLPRRPSQLLAVPHSEVARLLDLFLDLDARPAVPRLAEFLPRVRDPFLQHDLARALLRFGDARGAPALLEYAHRWHRAGEALAQRPAGDPFLRHDAGEEVAEALAYDALHFLAWLPRAANPEFHERLTAYFLEHLAADDAPPRLRNLARFALLHGRGREALQAALATLADDRLARLVSAAPEWDAQDPVGTLELLTSRPAGRGDSRWSYDPSLAEAVAAGEHGTHWRVVAVDYLTGYTGRDVGAELWALQSEDGIRWTRPAFIALRAALLPPRDPGRPPPPGIVPPLSTGSLDLQVTGGTLHLRWLNRDGEPVAPALEVRVEDLHRDADGDGLPDRLEQFIGTDPRNPDSNGSGIPDGRDKFPTLRQERPLTEEEEIYQAVLDTLAQAGRANPPRRLFHPEEGALPGVPDGFGAELPLVVPLPPDGAPVGVPGHRGVVLYSRMSGRHRPAISWPLWTVTFQSPRVGLNGVLQPQPSSWGGVRQGPRAVALLEPPIPPPAAGTGAPAPRVVPPQPPGIGQPARPAGAPPQPGALERLLPYELSEDGRRARVGVRIEKRDGHMPDYFDVEVRKIGDRWYPAECRHFSGAAQRDPRTITTPLWSWLPE